MGRPKLIDRENATDSALQVFWRKGFVDTSLKDLEKATGVFKPALYSEFGDKEGLFIECVKHYRNKYSSRLKLLNEPLGWNNIEAFLRSTLPDKQGRGCFESSAFARDLPILPEKLKPLLDANADNITAAIKNNLKAAQVKPSHLDDLTENVFTIYCGIGVLVNSQSKSKVEKRIENALRLLRSSIGETK